MFSISWFYLYIVGGIIYAGGTYICWRAGALDFNDASERRSFRLATGCVIAFAVIHGLFQFVFPFVP